MEENSSCQHKQLCFHGAPISDGVAIGTPYFIPSFDDEDQPIVSIPRDEIEGEIERYRQALHCSRSDLLVLHEKLSSEGAVEASHIIDAHIQMLSDPLLTDHIEGLIRKQKRNTETVFRLVMTEYQNKLKASQDQLFQNRVIDVIDLKQRVLYYLKAKKSDRLSALPENAIVFAKEIAPSETAAAGATRVSAFVTEMGGGSSHAALIARARGIPFVANINIHSLKTTATGCVIVDGLTGDVILNPTEETLEKYRAIQQMLSQEARSMKEETALSSVTVDGKRVELQMNVGCVREMEEGIAALGLGVGLFRTEFLLPDHPDLLNSEEEQYTIYSEVFANRASCIVMRAFDVGGDKFSHFVKERELFIDDSLQFRGVGFLLRHPSLFKKQLRALLRASLHQPLHLLLPLVTDVEQVAQTKVLLDEAQSDLKGEGILVLPPRLGTLIEVPSAVAAIGELARMCDFISLGTNDLIQSVLGIKRSDVEQQELFSAAIIEIVAMIKKVIEGAHQYHRVVTLCGEMASNPLMIPLLIGLGVDAFSCPARYIPLVKRIIRRSNYRQTVELADFVATCDRPEEAMHVLRRFHMKGLEGEIKTAR